MLSPRRLVAAAATLTVVALAGCTSMPSLPGTDRANGTGTSAEVAVKSGRVAEARKALDTIEVKGRVPKTGYSRAKFGPAWTDDTTAPGGHNGCGTRDDILARDMEQVKLKARSRCTVVSGTLFDVYNAAPGGGLKRIDFKRGSHTSSAVQIDHVVPLSDAWQKGVTDWSPAKRARLANDPANLQAVDGPTNGAKSDSDAATWLLPNRGYWCAYGVRVVEVKSSYGLWVTAAEHKALDRLIDTCPTR